MSSGSYIKRFGVLESSLGWWRYNINGKCTAIPSIYDDTVPENSHLPSYHCAEYDGYVWVWMGDGKPNAEPQRIENIEDYMAWRQQTVIYNCEPQLCLEFDLNMSHQQSLHGNGKWMTQRGLLGKGKSLPSDQKWDIIPKKYGFEMKMKVRDPKKNEEEYPRDTLITEFTMPDRIVRKRLHKSKFIGKFVDHISVSHYIPIIEPDGKIKTRAEFLFLSKFMPGYSFQRNYFETYTTKYAIPASRRKEQPFIEDIQTNNDLYGPVELLDIPVHKPILKMREMMKLAEEDSWDEMSHYQYEKETVCFSDRYP